MSHENRSRLRGWKERALSLLLSAVMLVSLVPGAVQPASAHWADQYIQQLVDWGVARADQLKDPNAAITRAEFAAIVNRAYGYTEVGPIPFTDVRPSDWFYDDIRIAYTAGYMAGTSNSTASPNSYLTREMATCILARNMMLKETPAESLAFTDSREISNWARGLVKTAVDNYIIAGYPDNTFHPKAAISKAQMAVLVTQCVGNPLNQPGDYTLGDVFNNVTITSSNVTLRDTSISGDLYVSGGVGLGNVKLENVRVLGRIIVSGTGESELGDASVVMRNVTAEEMLVDNMRDKTVTVRADGLTNIGKTTVRTNSYLEDNAPDENGLRQIVLEGNGTQLDLAGRIKEVLDRAPMSNIQVAKGTVEKLTVDEAATNATVQIDRNTEVKELNLDVAANVIGDGDVKQMNINAPGVVSSVFPEKLYIRPGITGSVGGETLDSAGAEEYSRDPKILSGYPIASDVAPTSFRADFATNKKGTVYWAVSNITDGSVSSNDLVSPPSYGSAAVKNGSIAVPSADTVVNVPVTGLTVAGSYYLSAVMQDARGVRSPVKVISFTTPDNTRPAFATGYPRISLVTDTLVQAVVMPTKSCKLYYAVLPQGASAPTANELRSASVTGNLGYGVLDVVKNTELTFVASRRLEELKDYVLYLWLCDADGTNSSNVQSLRFKTVDSTAPRFDPAPNTPVEGATNVTLTAGLDEPGTIYWVAVPKGTAYPQPNNQSVPLDKDNVMDGVNAVSARLDSEYAKLQVKNGRGGTSRGSARVASADTDVTMNVTGLARETAYDLYYVGQDSAGNFTATVGVISINTLDSTAPVVTQRFSRHTGTDDTKDPMANTDINLEFSEHITVGNSRDLLTLYRIAQGVTVDSALSKDLAQQTLESLLRTNFKLYRVNSSNNSGSLVSERTYMADGTPKDNPNWVVDYRNVIIQPAPTDGSKLWVTFPTDEKDAKSALKLASGSRYYFELTGIKDNSGNAAVPTILRHDEIAKIPNSPHVLPIFETVFAIVNLGSPGVGTDTPVWVENKATDNTQGKTNETDTNARVDASFRLTPESTENSDPNMSYEIVLFSDYTIDFDLYYRLLDKDGKPVEKNSPDPNYLTKRLPSVDPDPDANGWYYLGNQSVNVTSTTPQVAVPINKLFNNCSSTNFPKLVDMKEGLSYEFAISVTQKDYIQDFTAWSGTVNFDVYVLASQSNALNTVTNDRARLTPDYIKNTFDVGVSYTTGRSIGQFGSTDHMGFRAVFVDSRIPEFQHKPVFAPGDTFVDVTMTLDRAATVYYVVTPRTAGSPAPIYTQIKRKDDTANIISSSTGAGEQKMWDTVLAYMEYDDVTPNYEVVAGSPPNGTIADYRKNYPDMICGELDAPTGGRAYTIHIGPPDKTLQPLKDYYMYVVIKGQSSDLSQVYLYNFSTKNTSKPMIELRDNSDGTVRVGTQVPANVNYIAFTTTDTTGISLLTAQMLSTNLGDLEEKELPSVYADYTLLQALSTTYIKATAGGSTNEADAYLPDGLDGYSVFDVYAGESAKRNMGLMIRTQGSQSGKTPMVQNSLTTELLSGTNDTYLGTTRVGDNIVYNVEYTMIAVAYHTSSTAVTGDSFAAAKFTPIRALPPELATFSGYLARTNNPTEFNAIYSGGFVITLDSDLYISDGRGGAVTPVTQGRDTSNRIVTHVGRPSTTVTISEVNTVNKAGSTFTFTFTNMQNGMQFIIFSDGEISSQSGQTHGAKKLTITVREKVSGKQHTPYLEASLNGKTLRSEDGTTWVEM